MQLTWQKSTLLWGPFRFQTMHKGRGKNCIITTKINTNLYTTGILFFYVRKCHIWKTLAAEASSQRSKWTLTYLFMMIQPLPRERFQQGKNWKHPGNLYFKVLGVLLCKQSYSPAHSPHRRGGKIINGVHILMEKTPIHKLILILRKQSQLDRK